MVLFWITLAISVISSGFGLTKCLMVGVASTMADTGPAEGLLSGKFLLGMCGKLFFFKFRVLLMIIFSLFLKFDL